MTSIRSTRDLQDLAIRRTGSVDPQAGRLGGFRITSNPQATIQSHVPFDEDIFFSLVSTDADAFFSGPLVTTAHQVATEDAEALRTELVELRASMEELKMEMKRLVESQAFVTFLASLGDPEVKLIRPIPVTIQRDGDEFIASFLDANISSGGDTVPAAVSNLQSLIADIYLLHEEERDGNLGPMMRQQRSVLMDTICHRSQSNTPKTQSQS